LTTSGSADAAAYVPTTVGAYLKANPGDASALPTFNGQDAAILVKVHGQFDGSKERQGLSVTQRQNGGPVNDLVVLYDTTVGRSLMVASYSGTAPDLSTSASGAATTPFDLRNLGTPVPLSVT
jgi:hypothetical protein